MSNIWLPIALGTTLVWGLGQIVAKRGTALIGPLSMVIVVSLGEAVLFLGAYLAYGTPSLGSVEGGLLGFAAGLTGMMGYVVYYEAISRGTVSRIGTITAAYPALTVVLGLAVLSEPLTGFQGMGIVLLLVSVVFLGYTESRGVEVKGAIAVLVVLAFLLWGLWGLFVKLAVESLGEGATFAYFAVSNTVVGLSLLLVHQRRSPKSVEWRAHWRWPAGSVLLGAAGVVLLTLAMGAGPVSLVAPVTGAYPVVTVLFAGRLLKEGLSRWELAALGLFLAGILLVAWI